MIKRLRKSLILFVLLYLSGPGLIFAAGADAEFTVGRLEFIGITASEGIIVISDPSRGYLLTRGTNLVAVIDGQRISVTVTDVDGKYVRCVISESHTKALFKGGEIVNYSDSLNAKNRYHDAKKIIRRLIELQEEFIHGIESTEDTELITKNINRFTMGLDLLIPEMKRVNDRYPELKNLKTSAPDELKRESEALELLQPRMNDSFFKVSMFKNDEKVKMALKKLEETLARMKKPADR